MKSPYDYYITPDEYERAERRLIGNDYDYAFECSVDYGVLVNGFLSNLNFVEKENEEMDEFEALFTKVAQVQGDQELTCSCTECYWNMYFPNRSNSKECVSESLADFRMTPNSTECKGYWDYTEACGHPKR